MDRQRDGVIIEAIILEIFLGDDLGQVCTLRLAGNCIMLALVLVCKRTAILFIPD